MLFIILIFTLIELILISLLFKIIVIKKNIWQKISFLYNKLCKILILEYYNNISLKYEIIDYYKNVVYNKDILDKNLKWNKFKNFILNYFDNNKKIYNIFEDIELSLNNEYIIINKSIQNIIYAVIILFILSIGILYIIN